MGMFDGIMGLAYPTISVNKATPIYNHLMENGAVDSGVFGFYIHRDSAHPEDHHDDHELGGEIAWGGVNEEWIEGSYPDAFHWIDITRKAYWEIDQGIITVTSLTPSPSVRMVAQLLWTPVPPLLLVQLR